MIVFSMFNLLIRFTCIGTNAQDLKYVQDYYSLYM